MNSKLESTKCKVTARLFEDGLVTDNRVSGIYNLIEVRYNKFLEMTRKIEIRSNQEWRYFFNWL